MTKKKKTIIAILAFVIGVFSLLALKTENASAVRIDVSSTIEKWVFTQYYYCAYFLNRNILNVSSNQLVYKGVMPSIGAMHMPSHNYGNQLNGQPITCQEVMSGKTENGTVKAKGVFDYNGNSSYRLLKWNQSELTRELLEDKIGYTFQPIGGSAGQLKFNVHVTNGTPMYDSSDNNPNDRHFYFEPRGAGAVEILPVVINVNRLESGSGYSYSLANSRNGCVNGPKVKVCLQPVPGQAGKWSLGVWPGTSINQSWNDDFRDFQITNTSNLDQTLQTIADELDGLEYYYTASGWDTQAGSAPVYQVRFDRNDVINYLNTGYYRLPDSLSHAKISASMVGLGGSEMTPVGAELDITERYNLYMYYLKKSVVQTGTDKFTCNQDRRNSTAFTPINNIKDSDGEFKTCYAQFNPRLDLTEAALYDQTIRRSGRSDEYPFITQVSINYIISWLNNVNTDALGEVWDIDSIGDLATPIDENADCNSADLSGQGWILCPVLENSTETVDFFEGLIRQWMTFNPDFLDAKGSSGIGPYTAWGIFRNMANVIMIVILLVVIFSQLTGFGIDNYGIKKILPRLIAVAILINLSYIICSVLMDLSNIFGVGLDNLFESIGLSINHSTGLGEFMANQVAGNAAATGIIAAIVGVVLSGASMGMVGMIIALVLALVLVLIAILMFFVTLGARLIIMLMFTVISPIAIACYVLPNTQKFFKKWWSIFWTALVVYPICGAVYGLSFIIKAIVFNVAGTDLSGMNFWMAIVAVITPYLPFLMIPSLLKGALKGLGVLGATLGMMGSGLKKGVQSGINGAQSTPQYKDFQKRQTERTALRRANRIKSRLDGRIENGETLSHNQLMQLHDANSTILAQDERNRKAQNMANGGFDAAQVAIERKADEEAIENEMTLIKSQTNGGADEEALQDTFREAMAEGEATGDYKRARAVARIAGRRADTAARFANFMTKNYGSAQLSNIAREIAEGDTSANWRSSTPTKFEYFSQMNQGGVSDGDYDSWAGNSDNIEQALTNHVAKGSDLMAMKKSGLNEVIDYLKRPDADRETAMRIQQAAQGLIKASKERGADIDTTKSVELYKLAHPGTDYNGEEIYKRYMQADGYDTSKL